MIDSYLRSYFQPYLNKIAKFLSKFSPNLITLFSLLLGILAAFFIYVQLNNLAIFFLWSSILFDGLDGTIARLTKKVSAIGAYYDLISDRLVESLIVLSLALKFSECNLAFLIFMIGLMLHFAVFVTAGALFKNKGKKSMHYQISLTERSEAFIAFTLALLIPKYTFEIIMIFNILMLTSASLMFFKLRQTGELDANSKPKIK